MVEEIAVKEETLEDLLARGQAIIRKQQEEQAWKAKQAEDELNSRNLKEWEIVENAIRALLPPAVHDYLTSDMYNEQGNVKAVDYQTVRLEIPGYAPIIFVYNGKGASDGLAINRYEVPESFWSGLDEDNEVNMGWQSLSNWDLGFESLDVALAVARQRGERWDAEEERLIRLSAKQKEESARRLAEQAARAAIPPTPTLEQQIAVAYDRLNVTRLNLEEAATYLLTCKSARDTREADAWRNNLVEGTNDTQRRNWLRGYLTTENELVELAEKAKRQCELEFDLARYETERVKLMVALQGVEG